MVSVPCRDSSDSAGLSPIPDDEDKSPEGTDPADNAEGTVTWQQATTGHGRKGQKNKKKKPEGEFVGSLILFLITDNVQRHFS